MTLTDKIGNDGAGPQLKVEKQVPAQKSGSSEKSGHNSLLSDAGGKSPGSGVFLRDLPVLPASADQHGSNNNKSKGVASPSSSSAAAAAAAPSSVSRRFTILNKIGEGGYGNVYTVEKAGDFEKDSHQIYALKVNTAILLFFLLLYLSPFSKLAR